MGYFFFGILVSLLTALERRISRAVAVNSGGTVRCAV